MPEPYPREACAGKLPGARWQHLMCTKLQRLQPFLALLQMFQLLEEGPPHPGASHPQGGQQPGAPGQLGERPRLTPPATPKERGPSPFTSSISWALRPQAGGRPALQSTHLAAFHASSELSCHRLISLGSSGSCRFLLLPKAGFKLVKKVQARGIFILCILMLTAQAKRC